MPKHRLFLGISNVGTIVLLSLFLLANRLPERFFSVQTVGIETTLAELLAMQLGFVLLNAPFDVIGGLLLPRLHGRGNSLVRDVLPLWLKGVALQSSAFICFGTALIFVETKYGLLGGVCLFIAYLVFLTIFQSSFLNFVASAHQQSQQNYQYSPFDSKDLKQVRVRLHPSSDTGFSGGIAGFPGFESVIIPTGWVENLPKAVLRTEILRRLVAISTGSRTRGVQIAFAWNLVGFFICHTLIGGSVSNVAKFADLVLVFTLWSFIGLLVLPSFSRNGVIEVDHAALAHNASMENLVETMQCLDRLQDDEPSSNEALESIFYPIPCVDKRIGYLASSNTTPIGAWNAARFSIYLSGACLGLLSRAVHCNCGLPERWIFLPAD